MQNATFARSAERRANPEEAHRSSFAWLNERHLSLALAGVARGGASATTRAFGRCAS
ncbi:hypothetical protein NX871_28080 [Burkholderia thailandensis]|uniref:hypothetical protein n=1 Tax=Burkholderia thailandensis TaxID=57975 RepID=UPI00217F1C52|nr:hypothetical protein [Burkholderia thailandensis]MCS6473772.1 hypothetical protein [Burkholderia thailandensis]